MARLTVHCLWNRVARMHASGHIISPEFQSHKKLWETAYVSIGVRPKGNQGHPIMEAVDSKKAGNIIGGDKDNGASLDCWMWWMKPVHLIKFPYHTQLILTWKK